MSTVQHNLENMWCKMIVAGGVAPIMVAVDEQQDYNTGKKYFEDTVGLVKSVFEGLPQPAREKLAKMFTSLDSVGDPGYGTVIVSKEKCGETFDFSTRTILVRPDAYGGMADDIMRGFAETLLSEIRYCLDEYLVANIWANPNKTDFRSMMKENIQSMMQELESILPPEPVNVQAA